MDKIIRQSCLRILPCTPQAIKLHRYFHKKNWATTTTTTTIHRLLAQLSSLLLPSLPHNTGQDHLHCSSIDPQRRTKCANNSCATTMTASTQRNTPLRDVGGRGSTKGHVEVWSCQTSTETPGFAASAWSKSGKPPSQENGF